MSQKQVVQSETKSVADSSSDYPAVSTEPPPTPKLPCIPLPDIVVGMYHPLVLYKGESNFKSEDVR